MALKVCFLRMLQIHAPSRKKNRKNLIFFLQNLPKAISYLLGNQLGFAQDFYCQLCLLSMSLCFYVSVSVSPLFLSQTQPYLKYDCLLTRLPTPLSFQIINSLLRLIFGWTNSFIIQIESIQVEFCFQQKLITSQLCNLKPFSISTKT